MTGLSHNRSTPLSALGRTACEHWKKFRKQCTVEILHFAGAFSRSHMYVYYDSLMVENQSEVPIYDIPRWVEEV